MLHYRRPALERSELDKAGEISAERFRAIFEQDSFGVAICDSEGHYSAVNPAFARFLGYAVEELPGRPYLEFIHRDDRERSLEGVKSLRQGSKVQVTLERRYVGKTGEAVWGRAVISMLRNPDGDPAGFIELTEDISELARLREQLMRAQKMESIGTLAGGLAHDFNNFLGVILGCASLMRIRLRAGDPLQEPLRIIEQSAESAADLARQLLALAQPQPPQRVPVSVEEVLKRVVKIVKRTFDRRIRAKTQFAPELPAVEADVSQLEQAILNLCLNARDAMPEGGTLTLEGSLVTLGAEDSLRPAQCQPGDYVRVTVKDTGLGIEPRVIPRLFEPFFTTKESARGSGLGLAMVHRIVRNHGGFVRVESEVAHGSEFQVYLPAVQQPARPLTHKHPARLEHGSGTVLVVDDEPLVLAFAERGLQKLGYSVVAVENGRRACQIYASRTQEIDYVLLDMVMPEISGLETYQKLREINPQVRVILSSGYSLERFAHEARGMGADFIGKPYSLETLSGALRRLRHQ